MSERPGLGRPVPLHDEAARQEFVVSLRQYSARVTGAGNYQVFKNRVEPAFARQHGRPPATLAEVKSAMTADPYYQFWSATHRNSQEMIWDSVIDTVERILPDARAVAAGKLPLGSLTLDPDLTIPRYHTAYDIHLQPGGYHTEQTPDDIAAGAIYDLGVPIYSMRSGGGESHSTALTLVRYFLAAFPEARPRQILDLGCAIGNSTVPWAEAFPDAEVHGVDVGAPCLRYGHARANDMNIPIHFSQQNAEDLSGFESDRFDVVTSSLLFHETSRSATIRILEEIERVLKPGGVMIHFDAFQANRSELILQFLGLWEAYNNNENFLLTLNEMDVVQISRDIGLQDVRFEETTFVLAYDPPKTAAGGQGYMARALGKVPVLIGRKSA